MTWVLIVVSCIAGDSLPDCGSGISPVRFPDFAACEDAAVRTYDQMRTVAHARGQSVLLLDTRCVALSLGAPA
ncbi:hypothetical protein [Thalassobacter sp. 16PALIMAR09]|uniref:hypothetical protein n=1 Tax=Thalassobacter sp. 16PALIMAR09 TaxID=1225651 RepID=UPI00051DE4D0|nr:hypothetical protein [Thalassobacter sp. 16PALIMAR09]KGL00999.1 hypothetical protein PM04_12485 [Thalassobacter sp. 16PALIMAR09]